MLTLTDLFAGAGGSSTGAVQSGRVEVRIAANHWQRAVEVHNANHPDADHICADISQYDPRRVRKTDLLWASPECTNHSQAKGSKRPAQGVDLFGETLPDEAAERSRATMWDVVRFTEAHLYQAVVVENVVEVVQWAPFRAWLLAMDSLGYNHSIVSCNSMHAQRHGLPAPQSRDRVYIGFWRKGNRAPDFEATQRPRAYCGRCDAVVESRQAWKNGRTVGRYRRQYVYVCPGCGSAVEPGYLPAAAAIDWTLPGTRIGDRAKPLADKTRARIAAGIARYWRPFTLEAAGNTYDAADPRHRAHGDPRGYYRAWPADDPLTTLHTTASKAPAVPVEGRQGKEARPMSEALRTMTTRLETALVAAPFIAELRGGGSVARSVESALATITAAGTHHGLVTPYYGASDTAYPTGHPLGTVTTVDKHGLVVPSGGTWNETAAPTVEALRTLATREAYALVHRHNTGGAEMLTPASEVMRTLTTGGHQSILTPGDIEAAEAMVDDCLFRMLEPHEVAAGMAFPSDYLWSGTRRERVRLAGNAVTPPAARDLIGAVVDSLACAA